MQKFIKFSCVVRQSRKGLSWRYAPIFKLDNEVVEIVLGMGGDDHRPPLHEVIHISVHFGVGKSIIGDEAVLEEEAKVGIPLYVATATNDVIK